MNFEVKKRSNYLNKLRELTPFPLVKMQAFTIKKGVIVQIYHGSQNGNLKKLTTDHAKTGSNGAVYLAEGYEFAMFYAGCPIRNWTTDETGKLIVREQCEHGLEIMYKNKPCYVYAIDDKDLGDYEFEIYNRRRTRKYYHDVDLTNAKVEYIPDALEKLLQLERENKIIIDHWENKTEEEKQKIRASTLKFLSKTIVAEYYDYPDEYELILKMYPELAEIKPNRKKYKEALAFVKEINEKRNKQATKS